MLIGTQKRICILHSCSWWQLC